VLSFRIRTSLFRDCVTTDDKQCQCPAGGASTAFRNFAVRARHSHFVRRPPFFMALW
jgi:hypothetical protein